MATEAPFPALIGRITVAAAALERAIDACLIACLPELSPRRHAIFLSRLSFRQRLDILHELALSVIDGDEREGFNRWRRRVAKLWARNDRMLARERLSDDTFDEVSALRVLHRLTIEREATQHWALTLARHPGEPTRHPGVGRDPVQHATSCINATYVL